MDTSAYLAAFAEEFNVLELSGDWSDYPHATDSAIAEESFMRSFGRKPEPLEIARFRRRFIAHLRRASNGEFRIIPGADRFLERLRSPEQWRGVIATGSWSDSAELKLRACGLAAEVPVLCCDDRTARSEIVTAAVEAAARANNTGEFERIALVGDGVWDLTTARELNLPFVGIGRGDAARRLLERGASVVLADYTDLDAVFAALERATVP